MASELTRFGLSVRIVDKNTQRTDKSKALVLWARTLELINRMSPNCADRFIEAGLKTGSVNILSGNETIGRADMTEIDSKYKFVLMIPQSETERLLEEQLATLNVKAERQTELTDFNQTADGVSYVLKHADSSEETGDASWLIGADGAHSIVRHKLNKEFHGSTLLSDWLLADLHLAGVQGPPAINLYWHADGILALFPLHGTRHRIIANVGESSGPSAKATVPPLQSKTSSVFSMSAVWEKSRSANLSGYRTSASTSAWWTTTAPAASSSPATRRTSTAPRAVRG
jgi:2-polyprenyl-6-methoxyphenol hydroxylase-like FAD-dependent oxidoreductase